MLSMLILIVLVAVPITLITGKFWRDCTVYYPTKPQSFPIGLTVFCLIFFGVCVSTTLASGTDAYGYSGKYDEERHKGGTSTSLGTACMAILTADEWAAEAIAATWVVVCVVANSYPKVTGDSVSVRNLNSLKSSEVTR